MVEHIVLAGDIGGTKTNLGIFRVAQQQLVCLHECRYHSADYASLEDILKQFLALADEAYLIEYACFGVAGPIHDNTCQITNLPWFIAADTIGQQFQWPYVSLLNDLEANAWGLDALSEDDFTTLNTGQKLAGNAAIIAAGTGLGEAGLFWDGGQHIPFASEGGHTEFSPNSEQDFLLQQFLSKKYQGHVSWERLVSGMGLVNIYDFLCSQSTVPTGIFNDEQYDKAEVISKAALSGQDPLCQQALDWFVCLYGAEAGNQALKLLAKGGVYLGGGIAPKIITKLRSGAFMQAFCDKGRMRPLLEAMPVKVIMNDKAALYGPAIYAAKQL